MISQQYSADEIDCMRICSDTRGDEDPSKICTHFKYYPSKHFKAMNTETNEPINNSPNEGQCNMYHVDPAKDHPSYKCDMVVEEKQLTEFNCRQPIKPNKGYVEVNSPSTTERATTSTTTINCENEDIDVAFLFDDSGSMPPDQTAVKDWMKKLIEIYHINGRERRAAIMQWDDEVHFTLPFDEGLTADELYDKIDSIEYQGGYTEGEKALRAAFEQFFQGQENSNKVQIVFFLTDGMSEGDLPAAAQLFHDNGIRIKAVFIGDTRDDVPQALHDMLGEDQNLGYTNDLFLAPDLEELKEEEFIKQTSGCGGFSVNGRAKSAKKLKFIQLKG